MTKSFNILDADEVHRVFHIGKTAKIVIETHKKNYFISLHLYKKDQWKEWQREETKTYQDAEKFARNWTSNMNGIA